MTKEILRQKKTKYVWGFSFVLNLLKIISVRLKWKGKRGMEQPFISPYLFCKKLQKVNSSVAFYFTLSSHYFDKKRRTQNGFPLKKTRNPIVCNEYKKMIGNTQQ